MKIDKKGHSIIYRLRRRRNGPVTIRTKQRTAFIPQGYVLAENRPLRRLVHEYGFVLQLEMF